MLPGREAADMEMEWVVLEHELDELKLQNCEKGQWNIRLHLSCIDCRCGGFTTGQLRSLKDWMSDKIVLLLESKLFKEVSEWPDADE